MNEYLGLHFIIRCNHSFF